MKIALFGGSFNPIQNSHISIVLSLLSKELVDKVFIIPCKNHSFNKELIDVEHRIKMISLSFEDKRVTVDRTEADSLDEKSYSINTIREIKKKFPKDQVYFIIGSDILKSFDKWHKADEILKIIKFIVFKREGYPIIKSKIKPIYSIDSKIKEISSTIVREKIKKREDISNLVPKKVLEYINKNKLYLKT